MFVLRYFFLALLFVRSFVLSLCRPVVRDLYRSFVLSLVRSVFSSLLISFVRSFFL